MYIGNMNRIKKYAWLLMIPFLFLCGSWINRNLTEAGVERSIERIGNSLIYNDYWKMILGGLRVTVTICFFGIIMAFVISILMSWMNRTRYLKYVSVPLTYFIKILLNKISPLSSVVQMNLNASGEDRRHETYYPVTE